MEVSLAFPWLDLGLDADFNAVFVPLTIAIILSPNIQSVIIK